MKTPDWLKDVADVSDDVSDVLNDVTGNEEDSKTVTKTSSITEEDWFVPAAIGVGLVLLVLIVKR